MEAAIFFEPHIPRAQRRAVDYAGDDGWVASMPQLLNARTHADYSSIVWNTWFTANTEESVVTTPQGNRVVVVVHGGGIFAAPERFEKLYRSSVGRSNPRGFTGQFAAGITPQEARDVLEGRMPDGTVVPIFAYSEFERGIAALPMRYGVVIDFDKARRSTRGYDPFEVLKEEPNMIARAGGVEALAAYLDKARNRHHTKVMGNWHPYNRIDPDQAQTRIPYLAGNLGGKGTEDDDDHLYGFDAEYGMGGDAFTINMARYVAIARRDASTSMRNLEFEPDEASPDGSAARLPASRHGS